MTAEYPQPLSMMGEILMQLHSNHEVSINGINVYRQIGGKRGSPLEIVEVYTAPSSPMNDAKELSLFMRNMVDKRVKPISIGRPTVLTTSGNPILRVGRLDFRETILRLNFNVTTIVTDVIFNSIPEDIKEALVKRNGFIPPIGFDRRTSVYVYPNPQIAQEVADRIPKDRWQTDGTVIRPGLMKGYISLLLL